VANLPSFFDEIVAAGASLPDAERRRLAHAADAARTAIAEYGRTLTASLDGGSDDWALGGERYDELVALRPSTASTPTRSWRSARTSSR